MCYTIGSIQVMHNEVHWCPFWYKIALSYVNQNSLQSATMMVHHGSFLFLMKHSIIPTNGTGTMTSRMLRIIGSIGLLVFILSYVYFSSTPAQRTEDNQSSTLLAKTHLNETFAPVSQQHKEDDNEHVEQRPTINTITVDESDDSTNNSTRHYGYVLLIASEPHQQSRRALIREKYFGLRNNLVPCMEYDTDIYYKFWIYGDKSTNANQLELESVEWNDIVQTNQVDYDQEKLLKWVNHMPRSSPPPWLQQYTN